MQRLVEAQEHELAQKRPRTEITEILYRWQMYIQRVQNASFCPAFATTEALTFALPSNEYEYGNELALNVPFGAVFALSPPKIVSITTA